MTDYIFNSKLKEVYLFNPYVTDHIFSRKLSRKYRQWSKPPITINYSENISAPVILLFKSELKPMKEMVKGGQPHQLLVRSFHSELWINKHFVRNQSDS